MSENDYGRVDTGDEAELPQHILDERPAHRARWGRLQKMSEAPVSQLAGTPHETTGNPLDADKCHSRPEDGK